MGKRNHRPYLVFVAAASVSALLWVVLYLTFLARVAQVFDSSVFRQVLGASRLLLSIFSLSPPRSLAASLLNV